jgi:hypothetical protein
MTQKCDFQFQIGTKQNLPGTRVVMRILQFLQQFNRTLVNPAKTFKEISSLDCFALGKKWQIIQTAN